MNGPALARVLTLIVVMTGPVLVRDGSVRTTRQEQIVTQDIVQRMGVHTAQTLAQHSQTAKADSVELGAQQPAYKMGSQQLILRVVASVMMWSWECARHATLLK